MVFPNTIDLYFCCFHFIRWRIACVEEACEVCVCDFVGVEVLDAGNVSYAVCCFEVINFEGGCQYRDLHFEDVRE